MLQLTNYVGTKKVRAGAMTKIAYNQLRGWAMPEGEDGTEKGYLVEYPDSVPNHPEFGGYISWSPKQVFEESYSKYDRLCFGKALDLLKSGYRISREGWNGQGMYLFFFSPVAHGMEEITILDKEPMGTTKPLLPFIMMKTASDMYVPWLASQTDILSEDWRASRV